MAPPLPLPPLPGLPPTLTDGVVVLRAPRETDLEPWLEQQSDPLTRAWTGVTDAIGPEEARHFLDEIAAAGWASDRQWEFVVETHDPQPTYLGTVGLRRSEGPGGAPDEGRAEIGYGAHPGARGTGLLERALRLLLDWGFAPVTEGGRGLRTVIWWAYDGNWPSRKLAWRLGFGCDATLRSWLPQRGELRDTWVGVLTADEERVPRHPWLEAARIVGPDGTVLRGYTAADQDRIEEACSDETTHYWLGHLPSPYRAADAAEYLRTRPAGMATGTAVHWAICRAEDDLLLGAVSLMDLTGRDGPEIGYWLHPDARGRGVLTEAVRLAVRHGFIDPEAGGLGLARVRLVAAVDNTASRRVAERTGFRAVGTVRLGALCRDGQHDAALYDLLPGDPRPD